MSDGERIFPRSEVPYVGKQRMRNVVQLIVGTDVADSADAVTDMVLIFPRKKPPASLP